MQVLLLSAVLIISITQFAVLWLPINTLLKSEMPIVGCEKIQTLK